MEGRIMALGKCGEQLVQHLIGGVRSEANSDEGDLWHDALDVSMEVKTGSNTDPPCVREDQLDSHLRLCEIGFPYSHCWYVFVKYSNRRRENGENRRLFQDLVRAEADVPDFLGRHTTGVYVLDIAVVDALRKKQGATAWLRHGNGKSQSVSIGWRFFDQLRDASPQVLEMLGLDPSVYRLECRHVRTKFRGRQMEINLLTLLSSEMAISPTRPSSRFLLGGVSEQRDASGAQVAPEAYPS